MFIEPQNFPARVGTFWRFKQRSGWRDLIRLHEFYNMPTWAELGLVSLENESDEENAPLVPAHRTLEGAIHHAPELAFHQLAQHVGLEYGRIATNAVEYQLNHQNQILRANCSVAASGATSLAKRSKG